MLNLGGDSPVSILRLMVEEKGKISSEADREEFLLYDCIRVSV